MSEDPWEKREGEQAGEIEHLRDVLKTLADVHEAQTSDLAKHRTCLMELWGIEKDHPEDRLSERANEITWKYWNANCGPCDRASRAILARARAVLEEQG